MTCIPILHSRPPSRLLHTPRARPKTLLADCAGGIDGSFAPAFEIQEHAAYFLVKADVPGVVAQDISMFVDGDWLTVCGRRIDEMPGTKYRTYERSFGSFWRSFRLEPGIAAERSQASLENGVLTILVRRRATPS